MIEHVYFHDSSVPTVPIASDAILVPDCEYTMRLGDGEQRVCLSINHKLFPKLQ